MKRTDKKTSPSHPHHCECTHAHVKYCAKCSLVHCLDCKTEWAATPCTKQHVNEWWVSYQPLNASPTVSVPTIFPATPAAPTPAPLDLTPQITCLHS